jgi:hypothetical protein
MDLNSVGTAIRTRREAFGLIQGGSDEQLVPPDLGVGLENGSLSDLGFNRVAQVMAILGLDVTLPTNDAREKKRGLRMAAKTASISYASELGPDRLEHVLASGDVPPSFVAHMAHLLDEAPLPVIVMAVEEAASREHVPARRVWRNVGKLAKSLAVHRQGLWA